MRRRTSRSVPGLNFALEKPLVALQGVVSGDALIKAVFALLKRAVRCDFVNVCLRIVRRAHANVAYRMIDSRGRKFGPDLLEGVFFQEHPGMPTLLTNPGIKFINTREILAPDRILHGSRFYREVMQVIGFRHAIGMFFWEDPPQVPEAIFSLYREEGQPDFNDAEVAVLRRLHPHIEAALRRVRHIEKERAVQSELRRLVRDAERPICVLDWDLKVAQTNRAARETCAHWSDRHHSAFKPPVFRLPPLLRAACTDMKAHWRASLRPHPVLGVAESLCVEHPAKPLRAKVSLHLHRSTPLAKPGFVVEFEPVPLRSASVLEGAPMAQIASLTEIERALVRLVCAGKTNQEIADRTGKALGSVKNALHVIFGKADVRSRSALIARVNRAAPSF